MKKSIKLVNVLSVSVLALGLVAPVTTVSADTANSDTTESIKNNETTSTQYTVPSQFKEIDKYVTVKDNQYVLSLPQNSNINTQAKKNAESQLNIANQVVKNQNLVIDPQTKFADPISLDTNSPFIALAKRPANENSTYPWGVRSIFRSNAAVRTRVNIYNNIYIGALAVGDVSGTAGMVGFPWASLIGTLGSAAVSDRCQTWANRLQSYNNSHRKSKIYQDINWALQDSEGVWHD